MQTYHCIVLSTLRYKDNDLIIRAFSREIGLVSFIHKGAYKPKKGSAKAAFYQVLSQNLISTSAKNNDLKTVTDVTSNYLYTSLYTNIFKSSIAMFLSEVLTSSIKEEHQNISLFEFLETAFTYLDLSDHFANFHLFFLVKLTKFLGFYPDFSNESPDIFNLRTGKFELNLQDNYVIEGESAFFMKAFLKSDFESYGLVKMNSKQRNDFLNNLLLYFELHLIDFRHPKSLEVLNTLFS
jgi:DNA repair protein RecO (recombination protein O)